MIALLRTLWWHFFSIFKDSDINTNHTERLLAYEKMLEYVKVEDSDSQTGFLCYSGVPWTQLRECYILYSKYSVGESMNCSGIKFRNNDIRIKYLKHCIRLIKKTYEI